MEQRLESIINKGKILALASLTFLAFNCEPLGYIEPEAISSYTDNNACDGDGFRKYWGTLEGEYWEDWAIDNTCQ
jgi:hypothetical protein